MHARFDTTLRHSLAARLLVPLLVCTAMQPSVALSQADADALAAHVLGQLGRTRGVAALPRCGDGTFAAALSSASGMLIHAMDTDTADVRATRDRIAPTGRLGTRVFVDRNAAVLLPYGDNFVDLVVMHDLRDEDLAGVSLAAVRAALCPGGTAYLGRAAGEGAGLSLSAVQSWLGGAGDAVAVTDAFGTWAVLTKRDPPGTDEWTHRFHGPDNNPVSSDTVLKPPFMLQYRVKPYNNDRYVSMVSAEGRSFFSYWSGQGHYLAAHRIYNGEELWRQYFPHDGVAWPDIYPASYSTLAVSGDTVFLARKNLVLRIRGETGATIDTLVIDTGTSYVKWLAVTGGRLYTLTGALALDGNGAFYGTILRFQPLAGGAATVIDDVSPGVIDNRELGMAADKLFYYVSGTRVVCRNALTGAPVWENATIAATLDAHGTNSSALTFCVGGHEGMLCGSEGIYLCAAEDQNFVALSAADGSEMWRTVFTGNRAQHKFLTAGLLFGKNLADHGITNVQTNEDVTSTFSGFDWGGGCGPLSATPNYVFSNVGSLVDRLAPFTKYQGRDYKSDCSTPPIVAGGLAIHPSSGCPCPTLHRGMICNAPAGTFVFGQSAVEAERLERGPAFGALSSNVTPDSRDWWTNRANMRRSAFLPVVLPASPRLLWKYTPARLYDTTTITTTKTNRQDEQATPTVSVGGFVFWAGSDGAVRCWDGSAEVWRFQTGGRIFNTPTVTGGCVYVGSGDGYAYCIDAGNGQLVWRFRAAPVDRRINLYGYLSSIWPVLTGVLVHDGRAYFGAGSEDIYGSHLYCVDALTGALVWQNNDAWRFVSTRDPGFAPSGYMTVHAGKLWVRSHSGRNFSFDLATGATIAAPPTMAGRWSNPSLRGLDIGIIDERHMYYGGRLIHSDWRERDMAQRGLWYHFVELDSTGAERHPELQFTLWASSVTPAWDDTTFYICANGNRDLEAWPVARLTHAIDTVRLAHDVPSQTTSEWPNWKPPVYAPDWAADWMITDPTLLAQWRMQSGDANLLIEVAALAVTQNALVVARATRGRYGNTRTSWPWTLTYMDKSTQAVLWETPLPCEPQWQGLTVNRNGSVIVTLITGEIVCYGDELVSVSAGGPAHRAAVAPQSCTAVAAWHPTPPTSAALPAPADGPVAAVSLPSLPHAERLAAVELLRTTFVVDTTPSVAAAEACRAEGYDISPYSPLAPPRFEPRSMRWNPERPCLRAVCAGAVAVTDRDLRTRWTPASSGVSSVVLDLGGTQEVGAVSLVWYGAKDAAASISIGLSRDGDLYEEVDRGVLEGRGTREALRTFLGDRARFVRVRFTPQPDAHCPSIYEIAVHAGAALTLGE